MLVYVCIRTEQIIEREQAKEILKELALDNANTYICPDFAFSYLDRPKEADYDIMREDLICACDEMLICSGLNENMLRDYEFAKTLKIPIKFI